MVGGIVAVFILLFIGGFVLLQPKPITDEQLACSSDSDCVPAGCCHSKSAVNRNFAPDCSDMFCTAVCEPNTLDCGQAKPKCIVRRCGVEVVNAQRR